VPNTEHNQGDIIENYPSPALDGFITPENLKEKFCGWMIPKMCGVKDFLFN